MNFANSRLITAVAGCSLALIVAACQQQSGGAAPAQAQTPPAKVDVVTLKSQSVKVAETSVGRVKAYREAEVRPQISGIILKRLFQEGSQVKQGDILYLVDATLYEAVLESATAELAVAQAELENARNKANRYRKLEKQSAISRQDAEDADMAFKLAQAKIQVANAAIKNARINLDYTRITAPISGVVGRSTITEGALVSAGQAAALTTIRQLSPVYVDLKRNALDVVKQKRNGDMSQQPVTLTLADGSEYKEQGKLAFFEANVDESTGMVNARARFDNNDSMLLPGMFVTASLVTQTLDDAILAPQQGIQRSPGGGTYALIVAEGDMVKRQSVTIGKAIGDQWLVESGLTAGDRVIYTGLQKIKPDDVVSPVEEQATSSGDQ